MERQEEESLLDTVLLEDGQLPDVDDSMEADDEGYCAEEDAFPIKEEQNGHSHHASPAMEAAAAAASFHAGFGLPHETSDPSCLEEGEIREGSSGCLPIDANFRFVANELDVAIQKAKKASMKKRKKEKRKMARLQAARPLSNENFVRDTCRRLKEPKHFLIEAALQRLGIDAMRNLVKEIEVIERHGGQLTINGKRRRTPGGVLWNVLKSRSQEDYKAIMAAGKAYEKQQKRKAEESMEIDGQPQCKRQRTDAPTLPMVPAAQVKKTGRTVWPSRNGLIDVLCSRIDPDREQSHARVISAWVDGVKQGADLPVNGVHNNATKRKPAPISERLRAPVGYDDLLA